MTVRCSGGIENLPVLKSSLYDFSTPKLPWHQIHWQGAKQEEAAQRSAPGSHRVPRPAGQCPAAVTARNGESTQRESPAAPRIREPTRRPARAVLRAPCSARIPTQPVPGGHVKQRLHETDHRGKQAHEQPGRRRLARVDGRASGYDHGTTSRGYRGLAEIAPTPRRRCCRCRASSACRGKVTREMPSLARGLTAIARAPRVRRRRSGRARRHPSSRAGAD